MIGSAAAHRVTPDVEVSGNAGADYADAFAVDVPVGRSAEQWTRSVFEEAPKALQLLLYAGWRCGLLLRLGPRQRGADRVLGWPVVEADATTVRLGSDSPLLSAIQLIRVEGTRLTWTTVVQHRRAVSKAIWTLTSPVHRQLMVRLLDAAVERTKD